MFTCAVVVCSVSQQLVCVCVYLCCNCVFGVAAAGVCVFSCAVVVCSVLQQLVCVCTCAVVVCSVLQHLVCVCV